MTQRIQRTPFPWSRCNQLLGQLGWLGWRLILQEMHDRTPLFSTDSTSSFADKGGSSTAALPETDRHEFARRSSGCCWRSSTQLFSSWCDGWMAWGTLANTQVSSSILDYLSILSRHYSITSIFIWKMHDASWRIHDLFKPQVESVTFKHVQQCDVIQLTLANDAPSLCITARQRVVRASTPREVGNGDKGLEDSWTTSPTSIHQRGLKDS